MIKLSKHLAGVLFFSFISWFGCHQAPNYQTTKTTIPVEQEDQHQRILTDVSKVEPLPVESVSWIKTKVQRIISSTDVDSDDVLWLARVAYSETKDTLEAKAIMWAVRNRVETQYRGKNTYRSVVLDPFQFSAFNTPTGRKRYMDMNWNTQNYPRWLSFLRIAAEVLVIPSNYNPLPSQSTRHFVHENSLHRTPNWLPDEPTVKVRTVSLYDSVD